jgi:hypothetical protein
LRQIRDALAAKVRRTASDTRLSGLTPSQRDDLGALVSLEMGKIRTEGNGEVQEFVDIVRLCNIPLWLWFETR